MELFKIKIKFIGVDCW